MLRGRGTRTVHDRCTAGDGSVPLPLPLPRHRQSVSQLFHGPAPRSPLHRLAVRLRHSRSNSNTSRDLPSTRSRGLPRAGGPGAITNLEFGYLRNRERAPSIVHSPFGH